MGTDFTEQSLPPKDGPNMPSADDCTWAMLSHLSPFIASLIGLPFLGPLVIWLMYKDRSAFVADQAKESLNFQLAELIAVVVLTATCVGVILLPVVLVGAIVYQIVAAMEANKGVLYRYPYTIRLIS